MFDEYFKKANPFFTRITNINALSIIEAKYRGKTSTEILPHAIDTEYVKIARDIIKDETGRENPYFLLCSSHISVIGLQSTLIKINDYLEMCKDEFPMDILSVAGGIDGNYIFVVSLIRSYNGVEVLPDFYKKIFAFLGEDQAVQVQRKFSSGLNTQELKILSYTPQEISEHKKIVTYQNDKLAVSTENAPFLNSIDNYYPMELPKIDDSKPLIYYLAAKERAKLTKLPYEKFSEIFKEAMQFLTTVERDSYYSCLKKSEPEETFLHIMREYVIRVFVTERHSLPPEDLEKIISKLYRALFDLYIIQDLIDDPDVTDIKITDPFSVRVRIHGLAYLSDITFIDENDYIRFVNSLIIKNNIDTSVPTQTFTDTRDENYLLRFQISMPYISSNGFPVLHIRKVARKKMMANDLINAGMMDEKIKNYLLDCGKNSRGVVFAGPPGSGKTIMLNWFLEEAYESSAEILCIQENDELFSYKKGVIFQHVVNNPVDGQKPCSLETLGQMALVAGANVFIIGEVKGAEICSAITLANSGCRTAMTIHSRSSTETIDKMADLALRGYANSFEQAKRMTKSFQTIVYLSDFKVQEISEIIDFDENTKDMVYRPIYRREKDSSCYEE